METVKKVPPQKEAVVTEIKSWFETSKSMVLTSYKGLNVSTDTQLRRELREAGVTYKVVKNTMLRIAAKQLGIEGLDKYFEGTTAIGFSVSDPIAPAKILCEFMKKNKLEETGILMIKAGIVDGKIVSDKEIKALATLPGREELIAKLLGSMNAPITNTVGVLSAVVRNFVYVINAIKDKKEETAA